jgi:hypothetical protein
VCQRLAGGSSVVGSLTGSSEVGHLGGGLCGLVKDVLSYRTCETFRQYLKREFSGLAIKHTVGNCVVGSCGVCRRSCQLIWAMEGSGVVVGRSVKHFASVSRMSRAGRQKSTPKEGKPHTSLSLRACTLGLGLVMVLPLMALGLVLPLKAVVSAILIAMVRWAREQ